MAEQYYDLEVIRSGVVCSDDLKKDYEIYKQIDGDWVSFVVASYALVVGASNTCVSLDAPGKYRIRFDDGGCAGGDVPTFEYSEYVCCDTKSGELLRESRCVKTKAGEFVWGVAIWSVGDDDSVLIRIEDEDGKVLSDAVLADECKCKCGCE